MPASDLTTQRLPGQPHLNWQGAHLCIEGLRLADLASQFGTPLFVYSKAAILSALSSYERAFAGRKARVCYALKANSSLGLLNVFHQAGCGFDIVSGGELERALAVGAAPSSIIFSGVGKSRGEMRRALQVGIGCFNVESVGELNVLDEVARSMHTVAAVSLRVNPDVDAQTHPYISTGLKGNKFGIAHADALAAYRLAASLPGLKVVGIDCHIGSQITSVGPYLDAMDRVLDLVDAIEAAGIPIEHIDFGGGLGIQYQNETPPAADDVWSQLLARMDARGFGQRAIYIEPGRSLVGNAGVCVTQVMYLKPGADKSFCIVDAAMSELPRPALYQAFHHIVPVQVPEANAIERVWDVVGPVCESGDWIGRERALALQGNELLAVLSAGAYCMSMSSNYNTRPRPAEVLVDGRSARLIRPRETLAQVLAGETI